MDLSALSSQGINAITQVTYRSMLLVTATTDFPTWHHGTCVAVKYKGRNIIVSANHVLNQLTGNGRTIDDSELRFLWSDGKPLKMLENGQSCSRQLLLDVIQGKTAYPKKLPIIKRLSTNNFLDIACLVLDDEEIPNLDFYDLENSLSFEPKIDSLVFLIGCPGRSAQLLQDKKSGMIANAVYQERYISRIVDPKSVSLSSDFDDNVHFLIDYKPNGEQDFASMEGVSGTGVWEAPLILDDKKIWHASDIKLLGIQSSQFESAGLLKASKIAELIKLLDKNL